MKYYPDNTVAKYTIKLANRIELDGDWEVGLAEIIYPNSWYNMKEEIITECTYTIVRSYETPDGYWNTEHTLQAGYYQSPAQITKKCNSMFTRTRFSYDDITKKFTILVRDKDKLNISKRLSIMLGFDGRVAFGDDKSYTGKYSVDLMCGFHSIYVYCDIIECIPVGDTTAPLLRAMNIKGKYGDDIHRTFDTTLYLPVQKKQFDTIEVNIMTDTGQPVPFEVGKSLLTLHFRRSSNPYFLSR
jgi:hypothetical protein